MAYKSITYQLAKNVFNNAPLKDDVYISISNKRDAALLRKHLGEMIKRQSSSKRFTSRLEGNKLKVIRIV